MNDEQLVTEQALSTVDPLEKSTVLVVEDDVDTSQFIAITLGDTFTVITAMDGVEGLQKAKNIKPDLIVSDILMPKMTGLQMVHDIRQIKELDIIPIIFLTANPDKDLRLKVLSEGAQDCLIKPFSQKEL
jgi:CheY-like chemotaxis protein